MPTPRKVAKKTAPATATATRTRATAKVAESSDVTIELNPTKFGSMATHLESASDLLVGKVYVKSDGRKPKGATLIIHY